MTADAIVIDETSMLTAAALAGVNAATPKERRNNVGMPRCCEAAARAG